MVQQALSSGFLVTGVSRSKEPNEMFLPYAKNPARERFKYHQLDVNEDTDKIISILAKIKPQYIVDFAGQGMVAPSWHLPEQWYQTNLVAKSRIINAINEGDYCKKYIRISTPEVYGNTNKIVDETASFNPTTPYSVSHAAIDMHLKAYFQQYKFPAIIARFSNFFGPHQQLYRIIPRAFYSALSGEALPLHGGGTSVRSFIHGVDVANGILSALKKGRIGQTYQFSTDEFVSIKELVNKIASYVGVKPNSFVNIVDDRPGKDAAYYMCPKRANQELGWAATFNLDMGLQQTYGWVGNNLEQFRSMNREYQHRK